MKLNKPFELETDELQYNGRKVYLPNFKTEEQVAEELSKYCSLKTIVRDLLGNGHKVEDILKEAKEWSEDFEEPVVNGSNIPDVFVQIFQQFKFIEKVEQY